MRGGPPSGKWHRGRSEVAIRRAAPPWCMKASMVCGRDCRCAEGATNVRKVQLMRRKVQPMCGRCNRCAERLANARKGNTRTIGKHLRVSKCGSGAPGCQPDQRPFCEEAGCMVLLRTRARAPDCQPDRRPFYKEARCAGAAEALASTLLRRDWAYVLLKRWQAPFCEEDGCIVLLRTWADATMVAWKVFFHLLLLKSVALRSEPIV